MRVNKHSELWRQFWIQTATSLTASNMRFSEEVTGVRTVLGSPCTMLWIATLLSRNLNVAVQRNPSPPKLRSRRPKHYLQGRRRPRRRMKGSNTEAVADIDWMKEGPNVKGLISCFSHVKWLMHDSFTNTVSRLKGSYNLFSPCRTSYNRTLFQVLFPDMSLLTGWFSATKNLPSHLQIRPSEVDERLGKTKHCQLLAVTCWGRLRASGFNTAGSYCCDVRTLFPST